ncbi:MAG: hypothetical protein ACOCV8_04315 [Spirochaetota bacterium]
MDSSSNSRNDPISFSGQLTFSEKMIESDLLKFEETGEVKYYKSAKNLSLQDNAPYIFSSIKKRLSDNPILALKMSLIDKDFWESLQLIASNNFEDYKILASIRYIYNHTDEEEFSMLVDLAVKKLFKYIFIGRDNVDIDLEKTKDRNRFIQVALSYFTLMNSRTEAKIQEWEKELEKNFNNDEKLAESYHQYWKEVQEFFESKK